MTSDEDLTPVEIATSQSPDAAVIWLHGLGADGHDFEGIVPELGLPATAAVRFVFPHAPTRVVTINNGMEMPAWYDIVGIGPQYRQDEAGIRDAEHRLHDLIRRERERGVASERIVLAGFSQGGAVALHTGLRYPDPLAGIMGLSTYLPLRERLSQEAHPANAHIPVFMAHGTQDPVVPLAFAEAARTDLQRQDYAVEWHTYEMPHSVVAEEIADIRAWLSGVLAL